MTTLKTVTATRFTGCVLTVDAAVFQAMAVSGGNQALAGGLVANAQPTHAYQVNAWTTTDQQVPTKRTSAANNVSAPYLRGSTA